MDELGPHPVHHGVQAFFKGLPRKILLAHFFPSLFHLRHQRTKQTRGHEGADLRFEKPLEGLMQEVPGLSSVQLFRFFFGNANLTDIPVPKFERAFQIGRKSRWTQRTRFQSFNDGGQNSWGFGDIEQGPRGIRSAGLGSSFAVLEGARVFKFQLLQVTAGFRSLAIGTGGGPKKLRLCTML